MFRCKCNPCCQMLKQPRPALYKKGPSFEHPHWLKMLLSQEFLGFFVVFFSLECSVEKKIGPKLLTFYSNSLPLIFFLVFQGFDWRSGSMDPNPWSWMSGSIRKGIGKDGCSGTGAVFRGFKLIRTKIMGVPEHLLFFALLV